MTFGTSGGYSNIQLLQQTFAPGANQVFYTCPASTISYIRPLSVFSSTAGGQFIMILQTYNSAGGYRVVATYCAGEVVTGTLTLVESFFDGSYISASPNPSLLAGFGKINTQLQYNRTPTSNLAVTSDYVIKLMPDERILLNVNSLVGMSFSTQILEQTVS